MTIFGHLDQPQTAKGANIKFEMEFRDSNYLVRDHKVLIKIGPLTAAPSRVNYWHRTSKQPFVNSSWDETSQIKTFGRKKKARANSRPPNVKFVNTRFAMPPGGNVVLTPGVHFVNREGIAPSNQFFYNNTNHNFFPTKNKKDLSHSKILKNNFNWEQYGARNVIYENYR